jgi:hypothetical protein
MKYRKTFVSNSSSTSFVFSVAKEKLKQDPEVLLPITITLDLMDYVDVQVTTEEALREYMKDGWGEEPEESEMGRLCLDALTQGRIVCFGSASDQSTPEENMLCQSGIEWVENVHVIEGGGGY